MNNSRRREDADSVSFSTTVSPGSEGEDSFELDSDGTITRLQVRIYTGAELDLEITPVIRTESGTEREIVKFAGGKSVIDGDDDFYEFVPHKPVRDGDEIVMKFNHTDSAGSDLDYRANVDIDYRGGIRHWVDDML